MSRLPQEQPPSGTPPKLGEWLSRLVTQINGVLDVIQFVYSLERVVSDLSTRGSQVLICKNTSAIDVTLQLKAPVGTNVYIKRRDAVVNIIGLIDGSANATLSSLNDSIHLYYDGVDWSQI